MEVIVNGSTHSFEGNLSIIQLLNELSFATPKGIAVAVNDSVVPKTHWAEHSLTSGDKITIIKATQGG